MGNPASLPLPGQLVRVRGHRWRVTRLVSHNDCQAADLLGIDSVNAGRACTLLTPFDRLAPVDAARAPQIVSPRQWRSALRALHALDDPFGRLSCARDLPIALHAWQLEPALAMLSGRTCRLLLADDVGLGKTIQAGILLAALTKRGDARRVLILVPAGLREQWADELANRCGLQSTIVDAHQLRTRVRELPHDENPWSLPALSIASFDYLKRPEVLRGLANVTWDLLVIDEAHAMSGDTERAAAARLLATNARRLVFLTATPHAGDDDQFASLCGIGRIAGGLDAEPIWMFRRSRAQVGIASDRRVRLLYVRPTPAERRLHDELARYARGVWAEAHRRGRLAVIVLQKRAYSSAASLVRSLARRIASLRSGRDPLQTQLALPFSSTGSGETDDRDDEPDDVLAAPGLRDAASEQAWLRALLTLARLASRHESKLTALTRVVARTSEPLIVFTEYRDTLARVARHLARVASTVVVHGGLAAADRRRALLAFTRGDARVLVATDAAGEGLNLQAGCRWVVSLELPWSPRRVEQRIGRVDRIGQTRRVHALLFVARHTAEMDVLGHLTRRIERMRQAIGSADAGIAGLSNADIERAVVMAEQMAVVGPASPPGGLPVGAASVPAAAGLRRPGLTVMPGGDLVDDARLECERLSRLRSLDRLRSLSAAPRSSGCVLAALDRRRPWLCVEPLDTGTRRKRPRVGRSELLLITIAAMRDGLAETVDSRALAVVVSTVSTVSTVSASSGRRHPTAGEVRQQFASLLDRWGSRAIHAAAGHLASHRADVVERHERTIDLATRRERDLMHALAMRADRRLVQASLFDREALEAAVLDRRDTDAQLAAIHSRIERLRSSAALCASEPEVFLCALNRTPFAEPGMEESGIW